MHQISQANRQSTGELAPQVLVKHLVHWQTSNLTFHAYVDTQRLCIMNERGVAVNPKTSDMVLSALGGDMHDAHGEKEQH